MQGMLNETTYQIIIRVLEAVIISGIIGLDREKAHRPAGLRTHVIVTLGACLVTVAPVLYPFSNCDPLRMAAQVLSGIGFLGAGTIMRFKENVIGLTTAASLWTSACIGIVAGMGAHGVAIIGGVFVLLVLKIIPHIERKYLNKMVEFNISITASNDNYEIENFSNFAKERNVIVKSLNINTDNQNNKIYEYCLNAKSHKEKSDFMYDIYKLDVKSIREENDGISEQ